jgi:hypothetical protein
MEQDAFEQGCRINITHLQQAKTALGRIGSHHNERPFWEARLEHLEIQNHRIALRQNLETLQQRLKNATPLSDKEWEYWQSLSMGYAEDVERLTESVSDQRKPFPPLLRNQVWVLDYLPLIAFHQAINPTRLPDELCVGFSKPDAKPTPALPGIDLPKSTQADIQLAFERNLITLEQLKGLQSECIKASLNKVADLFKEPISNENAPEQISQMARYLEELSRKKGSLTRKQSEAVELYVKLLGVLMIKQKAKGQDSSFAQGLLESATFLKGSPEDQRILLQALTEGIITLSKPRHLQKPS